MTTTLNRIFALGALSASVTVAAYGGNYTFKKIAEVTPDASYTAAVPLSMAANGAALLVEINKDGTLSLVTAVDGKLTTVYNSGGADISLRGAAINSSGAVVVNAKLSDDSIGLFTVSDGKLKQLLKGSNEEGIGPYINDRGDISFIINGTLKTGNNVLLFPSKGDAKVLASQTGQFADKYFFGGQLNNNGRVMFAATDINASGGIYTAGDTALATALKPPVQLITFPLGTINDQGTIAFRSIDAKTSTRSINVLENGAVRTFVAAATGGGADTFASFSNVWINKSGAIAYLAKLNGSAGYFGLFTGPDAKKDKVIAEGDSLFGSTATHITGAAATYDSRSIDDQGRILFQYKLSDGRSGVGLAVPVPPDAPSISAGGIVPIYSTVSKIQPGSWVSIYGTNLATGTFEWDGDFPTSLGGVSVTINGKPCYLWVVTPGQINLQVPDDLTRGSVDVVVKTPKGSTTSTVVLADDGPSFSLLEDNKYAAAIIPAADGSYAITAPAGRFSYTTRPVVAGENLVLFGVGFGPVSPAVPAGKPFSGSAVTTSPVTITIGGVPAPVAFAGMTSAGLYQFNVTVPVTPTKGDQVLQATLGSGVKTSTSVYIDVE
jgi:uncharacterized protein (TIGR03437 family)